MRHRLLAAAAMLCAAAGSAHAQPAPVRRPIVPTDFYRLRTVADPQRSPDGAWVAYTVTSADSAKDRSDADL